MALFVNDARVAWKALTGVVNLYKPAGLHPQKVLEVLVNRITQDLADMDVRPLRKQVAIEGKTNEEMRVVIKDKWSDNPLISGPRYRKEDIKIKNLNKLNVDACGVLCLSINDHNGIGYFIRRSKPTKFYRVKGILGQARENFFKSGRILEKSTWKHIKRIQVDSVCSAMQSSHQKKMLEFCGVDMQSQAAYELAVKGPIRPAVAEIPMVYTIKCVEFEPPEFTLEIVCMNESLTYLQSLIHDLGMKLKSTAHCSFLQCTQYGLFNIKDSILIKNWNLENILHNMTMNHEIFEKNKSTFLHSSPLLINPKEATRDSHEEISKQI